MSHLPDASTPTLLSQRQEGDTLVLRLRLDPELVWFAGHFPGAPLLPGVAQLHLAIGYACERWAIDEQFGGLEMLKFQRPLRPGGEREQGEAGEQQGVFDLVLPRHQLDHVGRGQQREPEHREQGDNEDEAQQLANG